MYNNTSRFPPEEGSSSFPHNRECERVNSCQNISSNLVYSKCNSENKRILLPASTTVSGSLSQSSVSGKRMSRSSGNVKVQVVRSHNETSSVECCSSGTEDSSILDGISSDGSQRESDDSFHAVHSLSHEEYLSGRRKSLPASTQDLWRPRNDERFICSFDLLACFLSSSVSHEMTSPQVKKKRWFSSSSPAKESNSQDSRDSFCGSEVNNSFWGSKQLQGGVKALNQSFTRPKSADGVLFSRALSVPLSYRSSPYKSCLVLLTTQRLIGVNEVEISEGGGMQLQWHLELDQIEKVTLTGDNTCVNVYKRGLKGREPFVILLCSKDGNMKNYTSFSQSFEQSSFYSDISNVSDMPSSDNNKRNMTPEMLKETIEYECTRARSTKREQRRGRRLDSLKLLAEQISRLQMESVPNGNSHALPQDSSSSRLKFFRIFQKKKLDDDSKLSVNDVLMPRPKVESEKKPPMPVISLLEECSRYGYD
ncbi:hypothetical protein Gasu2_45870 [Galdieria sulphuraria]|nr:hypothetical protein Gasu2_45870 [Galdieria sulphuraria]